MCWRWWWGRRWCTGCCFRWSSPWRPGFSDGLKCLDDSAIDFTPFCKVLTTKAGSSLNGKELFCARSLALGILPLGTRLVRLGIATVAPCPLCSQATDDLFHRLYECTAVSPDGPMPARAVAYKSKGSRTIQGAYGWDVLHTFWLGPQDFIYKCKKCVYTS